MKKLMTQVFFLLGITVFSQLEIAVADELSNRQWQDLYRVAQIPKPLVSNKKPVRSCDSLKTLMLEHTSIIKTKIIVANKDTPAWCRVTAVVQRSRGDDPITVWVGLPLNHWNGRFHRTGGAGFSGGIPGEHRILGMVQQIPAGFAVAATDAGPRTTLPGRNIKNGEFALDENGRLDWLAIRNFSYRGIHQMTLTGRLITSAFYGENPRYAYFSGCSTGGRQGLMEAQRYPDDYDGILAAAPAINGASYAPARLWGQLLMKELQHYVSACKFRAATEAAVIACDGIDGVIDGVIGDPRRCDYDPEPLVGKSIESCGEFSAKDAEIVRASWQGPKRLDGSFMWYGFDRGANLSTLNATEEDENGTLVPGENLAKYFLSWHRYFLSQNPDFDFATVTPEQFEEYWLQSTEQYGQVYTADNPDLSGLYKRGGKV